jgi:hypothetical protein
MSLSISAGATTFTVTPAPAACWLRLWASPWRPAFDDA